MKYRLLDILVCPFCQNRFTLTPLKEETVAFHVPIPEGACSRCAFSASPVPAQNCQRCYARNIVEGVLGCSCGKAFPIIDSVPILLLKVSSIFQTCKKNMVLLRVTVIGKRISMIQRPLKGLKEQKKVLGLNGCVTLYVLQKKKRKSSAKKFSLMSVSLRTSASWMRGAVWQIYQSRCRMWVRGCRGRFE